MKEHFSCTCSVTVTFILSGCSYTTGATETRKIHSDTLSQIQVGHKNVSSFHSLNNIIIRGNLTDELSMWQGDDIFNVLTKN